MNTIPVVAQSGDDRYIGADKMILKQVSVIPHGLFNSVNKIGTRGELLLDYVRWLSRRVRQYGPDQYRPIFYLDVYGTVGAIFDGDLDHIVRYCQALEDAATPFSVKLEAPVDAGSKIATLELMVALKQSLGSHGVNVEIMADDWCNTLEDIKEFADAGAAHMIQIKMPDLGGINNRIEAALYCKERGVKAFLGGTANGTDQSTRITVHIALAVCADQIYNKPGLAVDEGLMIVTNEMNRTLQIMAARRRRGGHRGTEAHAACDAAVTAS